MLARLVKLLVLLIILSGFTLVAGLWYLNNSWSKQLDIPEQTYSIEPGASIRTVSRQLFEKNVTADPYSFALLGMYQGKSTQIKAGDYHLSGATTQKKILDKFVRGDVITYKVSLVEGLTFKQFRQTIAGTQELKHVAGDWSDKQIMQELGAPDRHPEGQFFPDTYVFRASDSDLDIYKQAYRRMQDELAEAWAQRSPDTPLKNKYEALILASIVEKETGQADERPAIAGVFVNRINKAMLLQTDPTIIYGLGESFDGNLTRKHLDDKNNRYNTYVHAGLPPTPIAMPGGDAIRAATNPAKTKHYYFVAKGDGSHKFSTTYKEHQRAVNEYQLKQKNKG